MDFQIPTDLIRQLQLSLRKEAGLSSYDPSDPTLPSLPSARGSVAGFDPSPPYLRCKHCQGRLLRGLQSVVCVYCGERQPKNPTPEPIAFKSTFGYQWLLQSLDLDGSETVGPSIEENELHRGRSTQKDEISLSDLLNLEITWPAESEKTAHSLTSNEQAQSIGSLNLAGVNLDNFFTGSKRDVVSQSSEEQPVTSKQSENVEMNSFASQENVSLFQNVQHSATAVSSFEGKNNDDFSGWQADFRFADSGNQHEALRSFDPFVGSTVDLSAHMDSVFEPGKDLEDEKPKGSTVDLSAHMDSVFGPGKDLEDEKPKGYTVDLSAHMDSVFGPGKDLEDEKPKGSTVDLSAHMDSVFGNGKDLEDEKPKDPSTSFESATNDQIQGDLWNNSNILAPQLVDVAIKSEDSVAVDNLHNHPSTSIDWFPDDKWLTSGTTAPDNKIISEDDDSFDIWNDFTTSANTQHPSMNASIQGSDQIAAGGEHMSDVTFSSSTNKFQEIDFGTFSQPDIFTGSFSNQGGSGEMNNMQSEVPASDRLADVNVEVGGNVGQAANDGDIFNSAIQPEHDVEGLLSQMHDLSFMLKSNLSVPSK